MKKISSLLGIIWIFCCLGIVSAGFVYDPISNTFKYVNESIVVTATWSSSSGSIVVNTSVSTWTTWIINTSTVTNVEIASLFKLLDSNTSNTLAAWKNAFDLEYAKLISVMNDASNKWLWGMLTCFSNNNKSPDELKIDLKNLYEARVKSLVEKSALLAGQLTNIDIQLRYWLISSSNASLALVAPKIDITNIGDVNKNGTNEFIWLLASIRNDFQTTLAKISSWSLSASTGVLTRFNQFSTLEKDYQSFSDKISLQGISVANLPQMETTKNTYVQLHNLEFSTTLEKEIIAYIPTQLIKNSEIINLINKHKLDYTNHINTYASSLLQDLTQIKEVTTVANTVAMIRAIYKPQKDILCNAFTDNLYISEVAPKISVQMQDILNALNVAANRIALEKGILVKNASELQQGYLKALTSLAESSRISNIKTLKAEISDIVRAQGGSMLLKPRSVNLSITDQVARMLSKKMQEYAAVGKLGEFNAMITRAIERLSLAKTKTTNKQTLDTLNQIEAAIKIFQ